MRQNELPLAAKRLRWRMDRVAFAKALIPTLDPWQEEIIASNSDRQLVLAARQSGKSSVAAVKALYTAMFTNKATVLCVAPSLRQSQELFGKVLDYYRDLTPKAITADAELKLSLEFTNKSRIVALPGSEKTVRGFSAVNLLILDEAAQLDEAMLTALSPMLIVSQGSVLMISTPRGMEGPFYEEWEHGEGWERYKITANEVPRISAQDLAREKRRMKPEAFAAEYECDFASSVERIFSEELLEKMITEAPVEESFSTFAEWKKEKEG
jgi:phage terminase large subunit-like protein